jgi:hypothetical protein
MPNQLHDFFQQFLPDGESVQSIPLKSLTFQVQPMTAHTSARRPTPRSVATLAAAAAANRCRLEVGELVPRWLSEPSGVVENGAARDILRSGLAKVAKTEKGKEAFSLRPLGVETIRATVPSVVLSQYFS